MTQTKTITTDWNGSKITLTQSPDSDYLWFNAELGLIFTTRSSGQSKDGTPGVILDKPRQTGLTLNPDGYLRVNIYGRNRPVHVCMWHWSRGLKHPDIKDLTKRYEYGVVCHINHNKTDNRIENLELASNRKNVADSKVIQKESDLPRNVKLDKRTGKYHVEASGLKGGIRKKHHFGTYTDLAKASDVAKAIVEFYEKNGTFDGFTHPDWVNQKDYGLPRYVYLNGSGNTMSVSIRGHLDGVHKLYRFGTYDNVEDAEIVAVAASGYLLQHGSFDGFDHPLWMKNKPGPSKTKGAA